MTAGYKALDHLVVKDDFYSDPDAIRHQALSGNYEKPPDDTPRLALTAICGAAQVEAMCQLLKPYVPAIPGNQVTGVSVLFRYTLANAKKKIFCHVDGCSTAGILYLSKPEDCAGGTTIYRHRPTGDEIYDKANRKGYDFRDPEQWEVISEVDMKYNRLVLYPGQLFHSITPVFFGDRIENSRLTQNVFIYREQDSKLM